jgi:hypothetical protein
MQKPLPAGRIRALASHDEPYLHGVRVVCQQVLSSLRHRDLVGHVQKLHLCGKVHPVVPRRQEWPRGGDVGCTGIVFGPVPEVPGPRIASHVERRRHTRAQVGPEEALRLGLQRAHGLGVGEAFADVVGVGASVGPSGLRIVDVGVHQAGNDPLAGGGHDRGVGGHRTAGLTTGAQDAPAGHHDVRLDDGGTSGPVDERGSNDRHRCRTGSRVRVDPRRRLMGALARGGGEIVAEIRRSLCGRRDLRDAPDPKGVE